VKTERIKVNNIDGILIQTGSESASISGRLLILLHGYGADMHNLAGFAPYLPEAGTILCLQGILATPFAGRSWFDIHYLPDGTFQFDEQQALVTGDIMVKTIERFLSERPNQFTSIIVGGISQGAGIAMLTGIMAPQIFTGLMLLSGRCPDRIEQLIVDPQRLAHLAVFVGHGTLDPVLQIENGRDLNLFWQRLPVGLTYREYSMGHEISQAEIQDMNQWLSAVNPGNTL